jgi:acyl-CoA synthetase (AMP-forming)/AMP-acid ligase II
VNLGMLLEMAVSGFGSRVAVGSRDGGLTYEQVAGLAGRLAADLQAAASGGGDGEPAGAAASRTLAVVAPTGLHTPVALFGAAAAGCSYAPLNYRLPADALGELVGRLDPAVVLAAAEHREALTGRAGERTRDLGGWLDGLRDHQARDPAPLALVDEPEAPAVLLYTSGTSSAPKAAVLRHDNLLSYVFNSVEFASASEDEANLLAAPPFHVAGLVGVLTSCYVGRRLVPLPRFSAEGWIDLAVREQATHAFVVPTMLARIVAALDAEPERPVPPMRHITYGGARLPLPVLERALELFPDTNFVNAYGLTETSSTVAVLGPADHREAAASDDPEVRRRLESAGRPLPGIEVRIAGPGGAPAPTGEPGEIWVRGDQVGGSYLGTASRVDADGWLHTGDQGWVDAAGYLFVGGRIDDMIISGGENIAPAEVENVLLRHPDVDAAAVLGVTDPEWGERVGAVVVPRPGAALDPADLTAWARERLGTLKSPKVVVFRSELPTTDTGKVLKRALRADLEPS